MVWFVCMFWFLFGLGFFVSWCLYVSFKLAVCFSLSPRIPWLGIPDGCGVHWGPEKQAFLLYCVPPKLLPSSVSYFVIAATFSNGGILWVCKFPCFFLFKNLSLNRVSIPVCWYSSLYSDSHDFFFQVRFCKFLDKELFPELAGIRTSTYSHAKQNTICFN